LTSVKTSGGDIGEKIRPADFRCVLFVIEFLGFKMGIMIGERKDRRLLIRIWN